MSYRKERTRVTYIYRYWRGADKTRNQRGRPLYRYSDRAGCEGTHASRICNV